MEPNLLFKSHSQTRCPWTMANVQPGPSHSSTQKDPQALPWEGDSMSVLSIFPPAFRSNKVHNPSDLISTSRNLTDSMKQLKDAEPCLLSVLSYGFLCDLQCGKNGVSDLEM